MAIDTPTIQVPQQLYQRLQRLAALTRQPIERLVEQALSASLPPLPDDVPPAYRDALASLEILPDEQLWQMVYATLPAAKVERLSVLREQRRNRALAPGEDTQLTQLMHEAELLPLRKAYAAVLLRWRGHQLPTPDELPLPR